MLAFVLIHDKEPSDSGSDVDRGSMLPENFDLHVAKYQGCLFFFGKAKAAAKKYCRSVFDVANKAEFQGIDWLGGGWQPSGTDEGEGSVIHVGPSIDRVRVEEFEFDKLQD